jgi:2,3-bisphosphoglycerate-dependent phosphoglycerate mutase
MSTLIIFRHGQSTWNLENKFTGWVDVALTEKGINEAKAAGEKLKPYTFDKGFTSDLQRAQKTLDLALEAIYKV